MINRSAVRHSRAMLCEGIEQEKGQELMYDPIKCPERLAIYTSLSVPTIDQIVCSPDE